MTDDSDADPLSGVEPEPLAVSRHSFHQALEACDQRLVEVAGIVAQAIVPMTEAFLSGDALTAQRLIAADRDVDQRCRQLEEDCVVLIARESPVASDLRRLVAVLRCISHVERSGDLLRHVGESLRWIHPPSLPVKLRTTVEQLGLVSQDLFRRGVSAWRAQDALAANELEEHDDQVDLLQKVLLTDLYTGTQSVEESVSLALIARYFERIADHGVEMARQVAYVVTGDVIAVDRPPEP